VRQLRWPLGIFFDKVDSMNPTASPLPHRSSILNPWRLVASLLVLLCTALTTAAWADPPGRVGRLGDMNGQVWFFSPDTGEWVSAVRNRPLTDGDRVSTDDGARAEVRIGSSSVRLDSGTELEVLRIDDDHISLQLHSGSVAARLRSSESAREFELRTAEGRFTTPRAGRYRFDRGDEASHVTVLSGRAVYEGPGSALTVNAGQRAEFWLENNAAQYSITEPVRDAFASWSAEQDRRDDRSASARYVSPEMTGAEDLDRYGRWEQEPEYGAVWIPRAVPVGWAPYRAGHWAWVSPWGWTWIDDQPWGFAPFHYGRWVTVQDRWCWVPGTYVRRPVYAPALVGWVGGPHLSVSISVGNTAPAVGWFPLAPREVYVPSYRVSPTYIKQVNVTHVTNITNITTIVNNPQQAVVNVDYRNRHLPQAVTVVPQTVLVNRQPVAPAVMPWRHTPAISQVTVPGQQTVVVAPPVPAPKVDETRRRHGFSPDGQRPALAITAPQSPATSTNLAPAGGINIPLPPNRANAQGAAQGAAPGARGADGEARSRFERGFDRRREGRDDGRVQTLPAQSPRPSLAGQPAIVQGQPPQPQADAARQQEAQRQQQEAAMRAEQQRLLEGKRQQEAQRQQQDAQRAQEAQQRQQQQEAAMRAEQQRQMEARRQQDAQRQQQEAQRAQELQRQQQEAAMRAEQQRQMEARRQQDAQRQQQQEAAARAEQQRQAEARRQQELQQQQRQQQDAQRQQEQRGRFVPQQPQPQPQQAQAQPQAQAARPQAPEQKAGKPEPGQNAQERQQAKEERQKEHGHQRGEKREAN
jgi:DNA segregation ATPase FtsK/SpoIIIE-like protein